MCAYRRPQFAAAAGDPIPFFFEGELHLFFLSSPTGALDFPERLRTSWQHVKSADLVNWEVLPTALQPGPEGSVDSGGIWTGSLVEHGGVFYLFYTGHWVGAAHPQSICLATSTDLVNFARHPDNPILLPTADCEAADWRDPHVFYNESEGKWWMLIAARSQEGPYWSRGVVKLATSNDLLEWIVEEDPLYSPGTTYCPECPELWEGDGTWYLVYSAFSENAGTVYREAASPRGPFRTPPDDDLGGRRWYAAKSAPWKGGRVFFGWVHDRVEAEGNTRWLWGGDFALPRQVSPERRGGRLRVRPADGVLASYGDAKPSAAARVEALGETHHLRHDEWIDGGSALIELQASDLDAAEVGILLARDDAGAGWRLSVQPRQGRVALSREPRPLDDLWADLTGLSGEYREVDGPVLARAQLPRDLTEVNVLLLLDRGVMEVYLNDTVALSYRVDPDELLRPSAFVADGRGVLGLSVASPTVGWEAGS